MVTNIARVRLQADELAVAHTRAHVTPDPADQITAMDDLRDVMQP